MRKNVLSAILTKGTLYIDIFRDFINELVEVIVYSFISFSYQPLISHEPSQQDINSSWSRLAALLIWFSIRAGMFDFLSIFN